MSDAERTLRLNETSIPSVTIRLPRGLDLRIEFEDVRDLATTPLAIRERTDGALELDLVERKDGACQTTVPPQFPIRGNPSGCKPIPRNRTCDLTVDMTSRK